MRVVLDTSDYGIPQSRKRLFIIGRKKSLFKNKNFIWPEPISCLPIKHFVDWKDTKKELEKLSPREKKNIVHMNPKGIFLDLRFSMKFFPNSDRLCSCICYQSKFWNQPLQRLMNLKEMKSLQGFPDAFHFPCSIPRAKGQLGNSISVNVLEKIIKNIFEN